MSRPGPRDAYDEPDDGDWQTHAACIGRTDVMFPDTRGRGPIPVSESGEVAYDKAREICRSCPVTAPCLAYALATRQEHGCWAGTTPNQRRTLRRMGVGGRVRLGPGVDPADAARLGETG